jgi:hypothetical protein
LLEMLIIDSMTSRCLCGSYCFLYYITAAG